MGEIKNRYIVEYWFRDSDEISDYEQVEVTAKSENDAIFKAKYMASSRKRHTRNFTIV